MILRSGGGDYCLKKKEKKVVFVCVKMTPNEDQRILFLIFFLFGGERKGVEEG